MDKRDKLVIATRGSKLALWQAEYVKALIAEHYNFPVEIKVIKTTGDKVLDTPLAQVGGKGLFTKELELELLAGNVDMCVHSMKDVPTELPQGLVIAAMPPRADARDALVVGSGISADDVGGLSGLPTGARVGTSSLRRRAQIAAQRPDLEIIDVRGNIETRLSKVESGELAAVILASAGLERLGWADRISAYLPSTEMVSAVGQGAIGVEIRSADVFMQMVCAAIDDAATWACVTAERAVMSGLDGGCQVPIGAYARFLEVADAGADADADEPANADADAAAVAGASGCGCAGAGAGGCGSAPINSEPRPELLLDAMVASIDGNQLIREQLTGSAADPEALGNEMVLILQAHGATEILAAVRAAGEGSGDGR